VQCWSAWYLDVDEVDSKVEEVYNDHYQNRSQSTSLQVMQVTLMTKTEYIVYLMTFHLEPKQKL